MKRKLMCLIMLICYTKASIATTTMVKCVQNRAELDGTHINYILSRNEDSNNFSLIKDKSHMSESLGNNLSCTFDGILFDCTSNLHTYGFFQYVLSKDENNHFILTNFWLPSYHRIFDDPREVLISDDLTCQ
jgi:hypothetical protein